VEHIAYHVTSFTIRYRADSQSDWHWVKSETGEEDGQFILAQRLTSPDFSDLFLETDPRLTVTILNGDNPGVGIRLFSVEGEVSAAAEDQSGFEHFTLGIPKHGHSWFALIRIQTSWLAPRHGKGHFVIDKDCMLISFLRSDGLHVVCLALSGFEHVDSIFCHGQDGRVMIRSRTDNESAAKASVLVAISESFESATSALIKEVRKAVLAEHPETGQASTYVRKSDLPIFEGLGYCTWESLGSSMNEVSLLAALEDLHQAGIPIEKLIIDDGWQSISPDRCWLEFEATKSKFPRGLKATISTIRARFPKIRIIAVWHAILGYWNGIALDGEIAKRYKTITLPMNMGSHLLSNVEEEMSSCTVVDMSDVSRFYSDFYTFLKDCDIDGVKIDVQNHLDLFVLPQTRRTLPEAYISSVGEEGSRQFGENRINCMAQFPSMLFRSQLSDQHIAAYFRNSEDYSPNDLSSHTWHIFSNACNSLITHHFNGRPDWDMFQSGHPQGSFHAAARCLSSGPINLTDQVGNHDLDLISQLVAKTPDGKRFITLHATSTALPLDIYFAHTSRCLVKLVTSNNTIGIFNCLTHPLTEIIRLRSFVGSTIPEDETEYILRKFNGPISNPMKRSGLMTIHLQDIDWAIVTAHPVQIVKTSTHPEITKIAILGLFGQMMGLEAVQDYNIIFDNGRKCIRISVTLFAIGLLGIYISTLPQKCITKDVKIEVGGKDAGSSICQVSADRPCILEVNLETVADDIATVARTTNDYPNKLIDIDLYIV